MEFFLTVIILHALSLFQGMDGAIISSNENVSMPYSIDEHIKDSGPYIPRLSQACNGAVGTLYHGQWVAVTLKFWSIQKKENMDKICKDLGCGGVTDIKEIRTDPVITCLLDCIFMNSTLHNCTTATQDNCSNVIEVVCEQHSVQLSDGIDRCAGRVELLDAGLWGSVCDDEWDLRGGKVVCAQLGCGTVLMITTEASHFGPGSGPIHMSKMNCNGTERNLWQCRSDKSKDIYCGHKEDAGVVCSASNFIPVTLINTVKPELTNWTTESMTKAATEDSNDGLSKSVVGCIVLSIALLLALISITAHCIYYKRRNGGNDARIIPQGVDSETSSDSDYEHYTLQPATANNVLTPDYISVIGESNCAQDIISRERNAQQHMPNDAHDSDSTSSGESYENTQTAREKLFHSDNALDSDSTSSGECYKNTQTEREKFFNPAVDQFCPAQAMEMQISPVANTNQPDSLHSADSDSTSSGECYENVVINAEADEETLEANQSLHDWPPASHNTPFNGENCNLSQSCSSDKGTYESSTSSEEAYENVPD